MKKGLLIICLLVVLKGFSQTEANILKDSIKENSIKVSLLNEKLSSLENDFNKQSKLKFSGYLQAQYDYYNFSPQPTPSNTFFIRRARLKAIYTPTEEIKCVIQPDFSAHNFTLADAYIALKDKRTKSISLWAGQFARFNYEIENCASQRDALESSKIIKTIYPAEKELGVKLEVKPRKLPLKFQLAAFNGNFSTNDLKDAKDNNNNKDFMGRALYSIKFNKENTGIDFGVNGYYGSIKTKDSKYILNSENGIDSCAAGSLLNRYWGGIEMQAYLEILGGLTLKAEYIMGQNAFLGTSSSTITQTGGTSSSYITDGTVVTTTQGQNSSTKTVTTPNTIRNFSGYYFYLIKKINLKNQLVIRYDKYDPNTSFSGDKAKSEIYYNTLSFVWHYYIEEYARISMAFEMPYNEKNATVNKEILDNTISIRAQVKF